VTNPTAQNAPGSTIASVDDRWLDGCRDAHTRTRPRAAPEEAVDAAGPVDAQTRPPGLGKRRTVSHSAPRRLKFVIRREKRPTDLISGQRPVSDNYPNPPWSPADSFATPSPAEIVVANRQK
jgi:hypothetical protein